MSMKKDLSSHMNKVGVTLLMVLFGLTGNAQQDKLINKVVAVVGERMILLSDVQDQKLDMIQNKLPVDDSTDCYILEELVYQRLLLHQADLDSVEVSEEQVEAELNNKMLYYERMLEQYGTTIEQEYGKSQLELKEEFRDPVRDRLISETMQNNITAGVSPTPRDIRDFYEEIPEDSLPRINSRISYSHIVFQPEVSSEEVQRVKDKLWEIRQGVIDGKHAFGFYATLNSDDPGSATKGGEFGCVSRGMFVPEFEAVAFKLAEGDISEPFESPYGWHILQLDERRGNTFCGKHILIIPKVNPQTIQISKGKADSLALRIRSGEISFDNAAREFSMDEETTLNGGRVLNMQDGSRSFDVADIERDLFAVVDGLEVGEITDPIPYQTRTGGPAFRIIRLDERTRPHVANLEDDYQLFQRAAAEDKKLDVSRDWFRKKATGTHIRISEEFRGCEFSVPLVKVTAVNNER